MDIPRDWTFRTADVARGFDRHVREQLPWYDMATGGVAHLVRHYLPEEGLMYDLGASTGNIGKAVADCLEVRQARLIGVEQSEAMVRIYDGPGEIVCDDVRTYQLEDCDVVVCFLVLMFLPPRNRVSLLTRIRTALRPGGCCIVFDKTVARGGYLGTALSRLSLVGKVAAKVPAEEIVAKELSLAGVQRPVCPSLFEIEWVEWFRYGEFAGWIYEKA